MADLAQLETALRNADAAGDVAAARQLAQAIQQARTTKKAPISTAGRVATGLADPFQGGAQLLTKMLPERVVQGGNTLNNWLADKTGLVARLPEGGVDQQTREREEEYAARRKASGSEGMDWARLTGNILSPANAAFGAASLPRAGASLLNRVGLGAASGAAAGSLAPVTEGDFLTEKAKQIGTGGVFGGAVPVAAAGVGRFVSPKASLNPDLDLLKQAGVKPTVGQSLGGRWNATEEKLQSLPIMGDMITNARKRALEQFNSAAINRAAGPVGAQIDDVGQAGVKAAGDAVSNAYDDVLSSLKVVKFDGAFSKDVSQLRGMAQSLTKPMRAKFNDTLEDVLKGRTSKVGGMTAETMKRVDSELGVVAARYGRSSVASEQELGDAVKQLQALLREQVARNSPEAAKALKDANAGWANLVRIEGAAKAAKNNEGVFTPAQLNTAIQTADQSVRKRAVGRGTALMQDLGTAGQNVLGNKVPNSGTFDRAVLGVGGLGLGLLDPTIPLSLGGGALAYSPWGQSMLRGLVSSRPQGADAIASLFNRSSPMLGPAGGLLALEVGK